MPKYACLFYLCCRFTIAMHKKFLFSLFIQICSLFFLLFDGSVNCAKSIKLLEKIYEWQIDLHVTLLANFYSKIINLVFQSAF